MLKLYTFYYVNEPALCNPYHSTTKMKHKQEAAGFKICAPEHAQKNETNLP